MRTKIPPRFLKIHIFILSLFLSFSANVYSQQVVTLGTPVSTTTLSAIANNTLSGDRNDRHMCIYSAAELTAAGLTSGSDIMSIAWEKTGSLYYATNELTIRVWLKHSTTTTFGANPVFATETAGATLVYETTTGSIPLATGWITFPFNTVTPFFSWDGVQNLEVITELIRPTDYNNTTNGWRTMASVTNAAANANAVSSAPATTLTRTGTRPQVRLGINQPGVDAGITGMPLPVTAPAGVQNISVQVQNFGNANLTSADITWTVNGGAPTVFPWSGTIAPGDVATIVIGSYSFSSGSNTIQATLSNINGGPDLDPANNVFSKTLLICSPLSGAYTINKTLATGGTNFNSFNDFSNALTSCGISGNVTATVTAGSGPYQEQVVFQNIPGIGAGATVTIQGNNETITSPALISSTNSNPNRHIVRLIGLQYFTINNLDVDMFPGSTAFIGIHILSSGNNITVSNCNIDMGTGTSSAQGAIIASGSASSILAEGNFNNLLFTGNTTSAGGYGAVVYGLNNTTTINNVISNNTINGTASNGVYIFSTGNTMISGNNVNFSLGVGIQVAQPANINAVVEKNFVSCTNPSTTGTLRGIYIFGSNPASPNKVINNVIRNMNAPNATIIGITNRTTGAEFYFNTVVLDISGGNGARTLGFEEDLSNTGSLLRNNIFYITRISTNYAAALALSGTSTVTTAVNSDYNVFYTANGAHVAVRKGSLTTDPPNNTYTTLTDWQTASGKDANSFQTDPLFQAGTAIPQSAVINGQGIAITGITTDILGVTRTNPPDPGAYEFAPPSGDAAITNFIVPVRPHCANTLNVQFELTNAGADPLNTVTINWTVNGVPQAPVNWAGPSLPSGSSTIVTLGTIPVTGSNVYNLSATSSNPNGGPDVNPTNDTYTYNGFRRGLEGAFTINASAPASATNYQTFTSIANALSLNGVCSPVTITVLNGPYTEQVVFNIIPGTSSTNTVVLDGNNQLLQFFPSDPDDDHILQLNGVTHMAVKNLRVSSQNPLMGRGIHITNNASKLLIENNVVNVTTLNSTSVAFGIIISGENWLLDGSLSDSVVIRGNTVTGGYSAIQLSGEHWTQPLTRIIVEDNQALDWYGFGIYLSYTDGAIIRNNIIRRPTRQNSGSDAVTPAGITIPAGSLNFLLDKNRIHDLHVSMPGSPTISRGVYVSGTSIAPTSGRIQNNLIYGMRNDGAQYGIQMNSVTGPIDMYHNTIVLDGPTGASTSNTTAIRYSNSSIQINSNIRNNILWVTRGGSGVKNIFDIDNATSIFTSNYNATWFNPTGGTQYFAQLGSTTYNTLAAWQATGKDLNSVAADPLFVDPPTGNYRPSNFTVDGATMGTTSVGVTDDILGAPRSSNPDPGAYEFIPAPCTSAVGGTAVTASGPFCTSGSGTITATGFSGGPGTSYQWQWSIDNFVSNINDLTGQTNPASASTGSITTTTYYRLKVTCTTGPSTAYSNIVTITVNQPVNITTQPVGQNVCPGANVTFTVVASNATGYQWRKDGVDIPGATSASYTINNVSAANAGNYTVVVSGNTPCPPVTSNIAALTLKPATAITTQPVSQSICIGGSVTFNVSATGNNLSYQWKKNGTDITGATSSSFTINPVASGDAANYTVIVTGECGTVTSNIATLAILSTTSITSQPQSVGVCLGGNATFSVTAAGAGLTYQWRKNGINITGATSATYTITGVTAGDVADYSVVVSGPCGSVTSVSVPLYLTANGTWTGAINSDWNNAGNWCGGIPTSTTDVFISSTAPNMPILINGSGFARNIGIGAGSTLTVGSNGILNIYGDVVANGIFNSTAGSLAFRGSTGQTMTPFTAVNVTMDGQFVTLTGNSAVTSNLTLTNGHIVLGSYNLEISNSSTGSALSHIVTNGFGAVIVRGLAANMIRLVPVGPDATSYNPVVLSGNTSHVTDDFTVLVRPDVLTNGLTGSVINSHVVDRTWIINEGVSGGSNVNVQVSWTAPEELSGFERSRCYVMQHNGTSWLKPVATPASGSNLYSQIRSNVTSFSPFAVETEDIPTPPTGIYPNPVRSILNVVLNLPDEGPVVFSVYDATGRLVYQSTRNIGNGLTRNEILLDKFSSGYYMLKVSTSTNPEYLVQQFIKTQ
jgi:hypothetical protein